MDAARAQNFPFYGYHRETTPFLSSMEEDLAIYEQAISSSYWTMPSIASLFTGMYTSSHGLVVDGDRLDRSLHTLPKILNRHGYRCAAFVRNVYVSEYSGLVADFHDFYSKYALDHIKKYISMFSKHAVRGSSSAEREPLFNHEENLGIPRSTKGKFSSLSAGGVNLLFDSGGGKLVSNFSAWLKRHRTMPFFAYIHFLETHSPYRAPLKFNLKFLTPWENIRRFSVNHDHMEFLLDNEKMTQEDFRILTSAYDNSIHYLDHLIGKIVHLLKVHQLYDNTIIVILADHGDNIGDHGLMFHHYCLYDSLIKIPLFIKFPIPINIAGRMPEIVQNVDILPTIMSLINEEDEKAWEQVEGNDLLGSAPPRRRQDLAVSELIKTFGPDGKQYREMLSRFDRRLLSVRTHDRKLIYSSRGDHEYYNLHTDPTESNNIYSKSKEIMDLEEIAFQYYRKMDTFYNSCRDKIDENVNKQNINTEHIDQLKALGYM